MLQRITEVATRRKEKGNKRCRDITMRSRHKIWTDEGKKTTNTIVTKNSNSQHEVIIQTAKWSQPKNTCRNSEAGKKRNGKQKMSRHHHEVTT